MTNDIINIFDGETGEYVIRELTDEEQRIRDAEVADNKARLQAEIEAKEAAKAKREAAVAKLAAVGLTVDDLKVLGLG